MDIISKKSTLSGHITVPGSKSHTIRALLLAALADGVTRIENPLPSADCISTVRAVSQIGARVEGVTPPLVSDGVPVWTVTGAGSCVHRPDDVINVGNSGSLLYFMAPIAATFPGWSVFTGDESIRRRPVGHVIDALRQLGADVYSAHPSENFPPLLVRGPITTDRPLKTDGRLSQYISGILMAVSRLQGTLRISLTDPQETPYLFMTKQWLESYGAHVVFSDDCTHIAVTGPITLTGGRRVIPSDWEAVAFPLTAALIAGACVVIDGIDDSGSQGDAAIVPLLQSIGADIVWDTSAKTITARTSRLSTELLPGGELRVSVAGFPDAICALAVIACFTEGTVVLADAAVCRSKETDRITVLREGLSSLGADITETADSLIIHGHAPYDAQGMVNPLFKMHGGTLDSHNDHRVAMAYACLGLALPAGEQVRIRQAECCSVSFPHFFERMNALHAGFTAL